MDNVQNCDSYINMPSSQTYIYIYIALTCWASSGDVCFLWNTYKPMGFSWVLNKRQDRQTGPWIMSRIVIVVLICHHHKPTEPCSLLKISWNFGGTCLFILQDEILSRTRGDHESRSTKNLLPLSLNPEDEVVVVFRNVVWLSPDVM
jgi:hypothetical protein